MRTRTRFPKVFVGHPFKQRFPVEKFRRFFQELPFDVQYDNTDITTKHLLEIMKREIRQSDYSIFDLSDWNSNVALELGLAEGLKQHPGKNYYILLNSNRTKDVPADVRGIQRLEYTKYDYSPDGLGGQLLLLLKKENQTKKIMTELRRRLNDDRIEKPLLITLKVIAHLRDHEKLTADNFRKIYRGTWLQKDKRGKILEALQSLRIVRRSWGSTHVRFKKVFA